MSSIIPSLLHDFRVSRTERLCILREQIPLLRPRESSAASDDSQNLCSLLLELHSYTGTLDHLQEAILLYRQLLGSPLGKHDRIVSLNGLADSLYFSWEHSTRLATLDEAAQLYRQALDLCRESDEDPLASILGLVRIHNTARDRALSGNCLSSQDNVDDLLLEAQRLDTDFPRENPLTSMLIADFKRLDTFNTSAAALANLEIDSALCLQFLSTPHACRFPDLWRVLYTMGRIASARYQRAEHPDPSHLRESLEYLRWAVNSIESLEHPGYWMAVERLTSCLVTFYHSNGDITILEECLSLARTVVSACPPCAPCRQQMISTMQLVLHGRAAYTRSLETITEAITLLHNEPGGDISQKLSLGRWLQYRWELGGDPVDLSESICTFENLLTKPPATAEVHFHLADTLLSRHRNRHSSEVPLYHDLQRALHHNKIAFEMFNLERSRAINSGYLHTTQNNLAECIYEWALVTGDTGQILEGLALGRAAISWSTGKPGVTLVWSSLIVVHSLLRFHFESVVDSRASDLQEILQIHDRTLGLTPTGDFRRARSLHEISLTHLSVYHYQGNDTQDLDSSRRMFTAAASDTAASATSRLSKAIEWLTKAEALVPHMELIDEYLMTLGILSQVAILGMPSASRLAALRKSGDLAMKGALHALSHERIHHALMMLEQGRGVFWQRTLHLRTSFDDLPIETRERLQSLSLELNDEGGTAERRLQLGVDFDDLIRQARQNSGQEHLLAGLPYEELRKSAKSGPVVVLIPGEAGSEVILIASEEHPPERLSVNSVTLNRIETWDKKLRTSIGRARDRLAEDRKLVTNKRLEPDDRGSSNEVLEDIWRTIVSPVVQRLNLTKSPNGPRPRIWLCPVGILAFIPFHAAGIHTGPDVVCLHDFAICSYTPTLTALINARIATEQMGSPHLDPTLLIVASPQADNLPPLPNVLAEVENIKAIAGAHRLLDCGTSGSYTVQGILESLPRASILHMACHGQQHPDNALETGFYIGGQKLTIADIMRAKLPVARLAVLSACETAKGDTTQPDEAIHLAAALIFAGFPSVIATMWSMNDADGPDVAKIVYEQVFEGGEFKPEVAPYALDAAVRQLREAGVHPSRWATYIHMGV